MLAGRRIAIDNGFLLACYFVPAWLAAAYKIWQSPIHGIFQRANVGPAVFIGDALQLSAGGMARLAWLIALAKLTTAAFFALSLATSLLRQWLSGGDGEEALIVAIILGVAVSFASMVCASYAGEMEALRLYSTETMLLLGGAILLLLQPRLTNPQHDRAVETAGQPVISPNS